MSGSDGQIVVKKTFLEVEPETAILSDFIAKKFIKILRDIAYDN